MKKGPKQFTYDSIHTSHELADYWFEAAMISTCAPLLDNLEDNYEVEDRLKKAGVITDQDLTDTESCALVVRWDNLSDAEAFIDRLNAYLLKKAQAIKDAEEM